jgi:hypothetical protein
VEPPLHPQEQCSRCPVDRSQGILWASGDKKHLTSYHDLSTVQPQTVHKLLDTKLRLILLHYVYISFVCVCLCYAQGRLCIEYSKGKAIPVQTWTGPEGSRWLRRPRLQESQHMKVVRLPVTK